MLNCWLRVVVTVFVAGGSGLLDPCEKEPVDALASLSLQQREDITKSAQVSQKCSLQYRTYQYSCATARSGDLYVLDLSCDSLLFL